jgi:hypothetical protein
MTGVFNDTEPRELLTSPPGAISFLVFAASFSLDIEGRRTLTLTLTLTCSFALPRPTSAAFAARTTPAAASCSTSWALWSPLSRRTGPKWLAALFAARKLHDRSLQSRTAQRPSSSLQPLLLPGTQPGFDNLSH